jgi:hypothetical protein
MEPVLRLAVREQAARRWRIEHLAFRRAGIGQNRYYRLVAVRAV